MWKIFDKMDLRHIELDFVFATSLIPHKCEVKCLETYWDTIKNGSQKQK